MLQILGGGFRNPRNDAGLHNRHPTRMRGRLKSSTAVLARLKVLGWSVCRAPRGLRLGGS